jgi:hypothetical protein
MEEKEEQEQVEEEAPEYNMIQVRRKMPSQYIKPKIQNLPIKKPSLSVLERMRRFMKKTYDI